MAGLSDNFSFPRTPGLDGGLIAQGVGTLVILASGLPNLIKAGGLAVLWLVTFGRLSRPEWLLFLLANCFFTVMNVLSLKQGIFFFRAPDLLLLPYYEFLMWGFYLLHIKRMLNGPVPQSASWKLWALFVAFASCFGNIPNPELLLIATSGILAASYFWFHEPHDKHYLLYTVLVGALIEYTGVLSGEWGYPGNPPGGVPLWFIPMWGGVGFFFRRLILPMLEPRESASPSE